MYINSIFMLVERKFEQILCDPNNIFKLNEQQNSKIINNFKASVLIYNEVTMEN